MEIIHVPITQLKPAQYNPRAMTQSEENDLRLSLETFGMVEPIVVNGSEERKNIVIGGHQRLKIWSENNDAIPCVFVKLDDERKERELNLRLNKNNGHFDQELLAEFDVELLKMTGFSDTELEDIFGKQEVEEDEAPDVSQEPPISKLGEVYQLGRHRLMCGDSTKIEDVEKLMGEQRADLLLTDPPYNVEYVGKTKDALTIKNDKMEDSGFLQFLTDAFTAMFMFAKSGASFYIWHADSEGYNFRNACKQVGLTVRQCLIWNKNSMVMGRQDYQWKHEPCLYGWKEGASHSWYSDRKQTTIIEYDRPTRSEDHPTMKPVGLMAYSINNSSKSGDIVLDLFLGSGSTLIACEQIDRTCYGMELDCRYIDVIIKRWEKFTGKKSQKIE